ncbi:MAG TPA: CDP-diacylglycerol--glycerol-3-phosphate 3-phosphatidyltransferase [Elusimicrobia bacterium]|nr:CDP-diacylglycerol--glycerol-3-phosphate 3-phosphatidyltransferase [Elusimicrobiota bacterium]
MTLATKITALRILLMPLFLFFLAKKEPSFWPGLIFLFLGFTDILDGIIARTRKERSLLGSLLDPLADKLLLDSTYLVFALTGRAPFWLFLIIGGRDLLLIVGSALIYLRIGGSSIRPRTLGKLSTIIQSLTIFAILFVWESITLPIKNYLFYSTALVTLLSGIDYLFISAWRKIDAK